MLDEITITEIRAVYTIPTSKGRYLEIKNRPTYALSFCDGDGRIVYKKDGKTTVSDKHHAVIIPKGQSYTLLNEEGGDFPIINFDTLVPLTEDFISIELSSPESFIDEFYKLQSDFSSSLSRAGCFARFYRILSRLEKSRDGKSDLIRASIGYIAKNLSDPELTNEKISRELSISEIYFRRLFKGECGVTPKQYILNMRISLAKELLIDGLSSVGAVSEMCGFASLYHFSRAFKSICGVTPTEYAGRRTR